MAAKKKRATGKSVAKSVVPMRPGKNGGMLRSGGNTTPGTGRPPDEIKAKLRAIGLANAVPLLEQIVVSKADSTSDRLKAADLVLKYGEAKKELVITSADAAAFFDVVTQAATDLLGAEGADRLKARVVELMEART